MFPENTDLEEGRLAMDLALNMNKAPMAIHACDSGAEVSSTLRRRKIWLRKTSFYYASFLPVLRDILRLRRTILGGTPFVRSAEWIADSMPIAGDQSPRIELYDLKGNKLSLKDDFKKKILIVRFWEDCCSYNIHEMSSVDQLYRKYQDKGLRIVTIHTGRTRENAEHYASTLQIRPRFKNSTTFRCY